MIRIKFIKRFALFLISILLLLALAVAVENFRGYRAWKKCCRELAAKGERLDWKEFVPPPVPDDRNFAMTPLLAPLLDYKLGAEGIVWRDTNAQIRLGNLFVWTAFLDANWSCMELADMDSLRNYLRGLTNQFVGPIRDLRGISVGVPANNAVAVVGSIREEGILGITDSDLRIAFRRGLLGNKAISAWLKKPSAISSAEDLLALLREDGAELDELLEALRRPFSRFNLHYEEGGEISLNHLAELKKLSWVLRFKALAELHANDSEAAYQSILAMLALADTIKNEPFEICGRVRLALVQIPIQPVWEGIALHKWNEEQIAMLQSAFEKLNLAKDMAATLRGERAFGIKNIQEEFSEFGWPSGWIRQNQSRFARAFQQYVLPCLDPTNRVADVQRSTDLFTEVEKRRLKCEEQTSPYSFLIYIRLSNPAFRTAEAQVAVNLAVTACALERYRLALGEYPEQLAQLEPRFIKKVPTDAVNGQPLKYKRRADGQFILYSIGLDLKDDGGTMREPIPKRSPEDWHIFFNHGGYGSPMTAQKPKPRDIVWQYPEK